MIDHIILEAYDRSGKVIFRKKIVQGQNLTFGRTHLADIPFFDDGKMSTRHFSIGVDNDDCMVTDLNSTNGTFLNGAKIQSSIISPGDQVAAGLTKFKIFIHRLENKPLHPGGRIPNVDPIPVPKADKLEPIEKKTATDIPEVQGSDSLQPIDWGSSCHEKSVPLASLSTHSSADSQRSTTQQADFPDDSEKNLTTGPVFFADDSTRLSPVKHQNPVSISIRVVSDSAVELEKTLEFDQTGNDVKLTVGRGAETDWEFKTDDQLSRKHFEIKLAGNQIVLRDLNSRNGTWLNDERVSVESLKHGDRIRAGETIFLIDVAFRP